MSSETLSSDQPPSDSVIRYAVKRTDGSVAHLTKEEVEVLSKESQRSSRNVSVLTQYAFLKDMAIFAVAALIIVVLLIYATKNSPARSYTIGASKSSFQSSVTDSATGSNKNSQMNPGSSNNDSGSGFSSGTSSIDQIRQALSEELSLGIEPVGHTQQTLSGSHSNPVQPQADPVPANNVDVAAIKQPEPVAQPAAPAVDPFTEQKKQAQKLIENWASSWARQDVNAYINTYASDYTPSKEIAHKDWRRKRIERLITPRSIDISLSNINVAVNTADTATITFDQYYRSPNYQDTVAKTVKAKRLDGQWFIVEEASAPK